MKKSVMFLILASMVLAYGVASAADSNYTTTLSTYPVTESTTLTANIAGKAKIAKVVLSNNDTVAQNATLYTLGDSTPTITAVMGPIQIPANNNVTIDFERGEELAVEDFVIRGSTPTEINVFIKYR
jgi:hypothetical protein